MKLPRTKHGFDSITKWVDRLSHRVHFIPSRVDDTAVDVASSFFGNVFKLHGLPDSIVSDRDPKFTSRFWQHLLSLCGIRSQMSSSHHPQTDGSSEVMNRMVENYLRCYCSLHQDNWNELLPVAEFENNSAESQELSATPFEIDLGWNPKSAIDLLHKDSSRIESVEEFRRLLRSALEDAQFAHELAKGKNSAQTAKRYQPHTYQIGDKIWLDKALFRDAIAKTQPSDKLSAKRFGPFEIKELIGKHAIRLDLPQSIKLHPVVHVVHTVPYKEQPLNIAPSITPRPKPVPDNDGSLLYVVDTILSHRKRGRGLQFLTLMKGAPSHEAQWQPTRNFVDKDGTMTKAFYEYITKHNLLPHLRKACRDD